MGCSFGIKIEVTHLLLIAYSGTNHAGNLTHLTYMALVEKNIP